MEKSASKRPKGTETPEKAVVKKRKQEEAASEQEPSGEDLMLQEEAADKESLQREAEEEANLSQEPKSDRPTKVSSTEGASQEEEDDESSVPFRVHRIGGMQSFIDNLSEDAQASFNQGVELMEEALEEIEETEASPDVDGKLTANISFRFRTEDNQEIMVVMKSGKEADGKFDPTTDVCLVTKFDPKHWSAEYMSSSDDVMPTSDTPVYWAAYKVHLRYKWPEAPNALIHGHSFQTEELARKLGFPITADECLAATPKDAQSMMALFEKNPYPKNKIFVRRGHGFLLLGNNLQEALDEFKKTIVPNV